jgi:hypothetical protein
MERNSAMRRSTTDDGYSDSHCSCLPAALFGRWIDRVRGREHRPGRLQPAESGKGAYPAMCERRTNPTDATQRETVVPGAEVRAAAERELAAFYAAVSENYGPEEATVAAENWIEELKKAESPFGGTFPGWHQITIAAARGLAARVAVEHRTGDKYGGQDESRNCEGFPAGKARGSGMQTGGPLLVGGWAASLRQTVPGQPGNVEAEIDSWRRARDNRPCR